MVRFAVLFLVLLGITIAMLAALLAQAGYSLFAPEMRMIQVVAVLIAAYVAWRVGNLLNARDNSLARRDAPGGAGQTKLSSLFGPRKSPAQAAREARIEARRQKLIAEGKLEAGEAGPAAASPPDEIVPTRVAASAPIKDRMAARAERVRRAKAEGKLD